MSHSSSAIEAAAVSGLPSPSDECPTIPVPGPNSCESRGVTAQEALDNVADALRDRLEVADTAGAEATQTSEEEES